MKKDMLESLTGLLSVSEKRYISEHLALRGKENNFSDLFNSISSKKTNAVSKIKNLNTYYVTKKQLTEKIFKLLRMYHSDSSRKQVLKNICIDVEILFNKGAFAYCDKLIDSALTVCKKNEWFELELYLLAWQESTLIALSVGNLQKEIHANLKRVRAVLSMLENLNQHKQCMYDIYLILRKISFLRNASDFARIHKIMHTYKGGYAKKIASYRARMCYCMAYTYYYFALQDHAQSYRYTQEHVKTIEAFQKASGTSMPEYLCTALQHVINCEMNLREHVKLQQSLHKIRGIKFNSKREEAKVVIHTYVIETTMYAQTGNFDRIQNMLPTLEHGLKVYEDFITKEQKIVLYYNMAYLFIGSQQYRLALQWNNKILNDYDDLFVREDVYCFARILNLIIHYELGNYSMLKHLVLSTYRFLYKKKKVFGIENAIMKFIRYQLLHYQTSKRITGSLRQLLFTVKQLCTDKKEQAALEYFDFISWLESKIQNRSFAGIVKEKAEEHAEEHA